MKKKTQNDTCRKQVSVGSRFLWLEWSLIVAFLATLSIAHKPLSNSTSLLYGNVYVTSSLKEDHLGHCYGEPVFIDYSEIYKSIVVVSNNMNRAIVCIFPLSSTTSDKPELKAPATGLPVNSPHNSYYSLDWARGLLYFSTEQTIFALSLKSNHSVGLMLYRSNRSITIKGLVTLPHLNKLMWLEYDDSILTTNLMQSSQDGKDVVLLRKMTMQPVNFLYYDYSSDHFLMLEPKYGYSRSGYLFNITHLDQPTRVNVNYTGHQVNNVIFYEHQLIFIAFFLQNGEFKNGSILASNLSQLDQGKTELLLTLQQQTEVLGVMSDKLRPRIIDQCQKNLCKQPEDYCIPHNQSTYICQSNPSRYFIFDDESASDLKMIVIIIVSVTCFGLVLIAACAMLLTKKKVRFYQIRLKNINRVNSSKIEAKPEATEEIAE